ncbi:hypothetical protein BD626DRAFT_392188, partial [Schizophyllum amplum]
RPRECLFHGLPTELLCAIFMMCGEIDDFSVYPRDPSLDPYLLYPKPIRYSQTTILLGYVCSRWLTVTRGCPQLWTMVDLPFPQRRDVTVLALCLHYSAGLPMTLHIVDDERYPVKDRNLDVWRRFVRIVASAAQRWTGIHISIRAKNLRATLRLWDVFYASSALRAVRWHNIVVDVHAHAHTLRHLTYVSVNHILSLHVMELFRACPRLQVFEGTIVPPRSFLFGREADTRVPALATPITLPHLRILMLSGGDMPDLASLFDGLMVPLLDRLDLGTTNMQAHAIECMLKRSSARLFMLTLRHISSGKRNIERIKALLRCPALQQLKIFLYQPYHDSDFDLRPCVPPNVVLYTSVYQHADDTYHLATTGRKEGNRIL